jgi:arsenate reductase
MAEGWARHLHDDLFEVYSAGTETHGLNPLAVQVMAEVGIDISGHYSKLVNELPDQHFDLVVTVCGYADAKCPFFPGSTKVIHRGFDDPPKMAKERAALETDALVFYRQVRDEIQRFIKEFLPYF